MENQSVTSTEAKPEPARRGRPASAIGKRPPASKTQNIAEPPTAQVVETARRAANRVIARRNEAAAEARKQTTSSEAHAASPVIIVRSPDERIAAGKALRDKVLRAQQGVWKAGKARANPIDILRKSDSERMQDLVPIRYGRMLVSPFTFYRGSASVMAADLARGPVTGLTVQACGDCHLLNFGGFATPERNMIFSINDFDETLPAPWEWDVKRLVASMVLAARSNGFSDTIAREIAVNCARSYRERLRAFAQQSPLEVWYDKITVEEFVSALPRRMQKGVQKRIAKAKGATGSELDFPKLAGTAGGQTRIRDQPPLIFHPERVHAADWQNILRDVMRAYRDTLTDDRKSLFDQYHIVDAAVKVVGIGSVGRRCGIILMMSEANTPLFLQFKEAVASVLEPFAGRSAYAHHGQRVVAGQRLMQPASDIFLGWVTSSTGQHYYLRQLRDAKIKPLVETYDAEMLDFYGRACGWELARAHAKGREVFTISGYLGNSDEFDEALGSFAIAYADQAERDHAALKSAVRAGKVSVFREA